MFNGKGVLEAPNKDVYNGTFLNGWFNGDGTIQYGNNEKQFQGKFVNGLLNGKGVL